MRVLDKQELRELKRSFNPVQKTLCKKFEQTGGSMKVIIDDIEYKLSFNSTKVYLEHISNRPHKNK
tara:strand:+ start:648 stop:845 length:198 start_codon:yes stop_codon:yes gene_type:complete